MSDSIGLVASGGEMWLDKRTYDSNWALVARINGTDPEAPHTVTEYTNETTGRVVCHIQMG